MSERLKKAEQNLQLEADLGEYIRDQWESTCDDAWGGGPVEEKARREQEAAWYKEEERLMRRIPPSATAETSSAESMCALLGEAAEAFVASDPDPPRAGGMAARFKIALPYYYTVVWEPHPAHAACENYRLPYYT